HLQTKLLEGVAPRLAGVLSLRIALDGEQTAQSRRLDDHLAPAVGPLVLAIDIQHARGQPGALAPAQENAVAVRGGAVLVVDLNDLWLVQLALDAFLLLHGEAVAPDVAVIAVSGLLHKAPRRPLPPRPHTAA